MKSDAMDQDSEFDSLQFLKELQEMVQEMRDGFTTAMQALAKVQYGDQVLKETVDSNKAQYESQLADVVQMVLALKTEFGGMVGQLEVASHNQKSLQNQVQMLQFERDILLEELEKDGAISSDVRAKYHSGRSRPNGLNKTSDSTSLAALLERAQTAFQNNNNNSGDSSHNNSQVTSDSGVNTCPHGDLSSCEEVTPPPQMVSPRVQSYISGLGSVDPDHVEDIPLEEHYDSDSSLTAAANKSLDLSRSLGDKCQDLAALDSSDEDKPAECVEEKIVPEMAEKVQSTPKEDEEPYDHSSPCEVSPPRSVAPHERNARETQRSRIAREILETEKKYCSNMWTIIDHFAVPLKQANILSTKEVGTMFPQCLWRIYGHHCLFLQKLENRLANWKWQCVLGDIFAQFIDSSQCDLLTQYQLYVNEFPLSLHQIRKSYRHSTRFKKFLKACHRHPCCGGLDIGAYLLTPIQRMPRYVLLLKSLLKYTDLEHPDHYYIEQSLQKLNSFLTELNESISNSMQAVAEDGTPKPKRKLRAHSMRSTSGSSYVGQGRLTISNSALPATRTISRVSQPETHASYHRGENLHDISDISCVGSPRISLSNNTPMASPNYGATLPGSCRDTTFAFGRDSDSSIREERRRRLRQRRPHSAMDYADAPRIVYPEDREWMNGEGRAGQGHNKRACRPSQRPFSMLDRLSGESFRSQGSSEYNRPQHLSHATSQESLNTLASNTLSESVAHSRRQAANTRASYPNGRPYVIEYNTLPSRGRLADREQHRALQQQQQQQQQPGFPSPAHNDLLHQSMPRLNQDFGIYGDNDDENCVDDSLYLSPRSAGNTARLQHLANSSAVMQSRSKSHGDGLHRDTTDLDLSQNQLNMALARSLAEDHVNGALPRKVSTPYVDPRTRIGPSGRRAVHPAPVNRPVRLKDNLWEEPSRFGDVSIADSTLNESTATLGRGKDGRKKKGKKNNNMDTSSMMDISTTDGDKKKKSFSFKNIFFRKRKLEQAHKPPSPTVGDVDCTPEANKIRESIKDDHPTPVNQPVDAAAAMSHDVVREQAAPSDDTVYVEKVEMEQTVELESYEDENGDPCSAV